MYLGLLKHTLVKTLAKTVKIGLREHRCFHSSSFITTLLTPLFLALSVIIALKTFLLRSCKK